MRFSTKNQLLAMLLLAAFSAFSQVSNDECSGAMMLPVNSDLSCALHSNGTTLDATWSALDCNGTNNTVDVWYSFVATAPSQILSIDATVVNYLGNPYLGFEVYDGDCDNLHSLFCQFEVGLKKDGIMNGLMPGETYYIRLFTTGQSTFEYSICIRSIPPPPANADCAQAEILTPSPNPGCITQTEGSTAGSFTNANGSGNCVNGGDISVWYSFTATSSTHLVSINDVQTLYGINPYFVMQYYEGTDCNNLTYMGCFSNSYYLENLTVGKTYFIRCNSSSLGAHSFKICIGTYLPPSNDDCSTAMPVVVGDILNCGDPASGTTAGSTAVQGAACFNNAGDVWYSFMATQTAHGIQFLNILDIFENNQGSLATELLTGSCGNLTSVRCWNNITYNTQIIGDLIPGQTYYLRIASPNNPPFNFDFCIYTPSPPPVNDACVNAIALLLQPDNNCVPIPGTTANATFVPGVPDLCCNRGDVWYSFVASQANIDINFSDIVSGAYGYNVANLQLYAQGCGNLEAISWLHYLNSDEKASYTNLTPGSTYYIRIFQADALNIDFNICITAPPPPVNDECVNALPLPINNDLSCNMVLTARTVNATASRPDCEGNIVNDTWYQFTATTHTYRFELSIGTGNWGQWGFEIFSGDCNNLTTIHCEQPENPVTLVQDGFIPGEMYYLRLYSAPNISPEITVCTRAMPLPPANDECVGAIVVNTEPDLSCNAPTLGSTLGAGSSQLDCLGNPSRDIWYTFTATGFSHVLELVEITDYFGNPSKWGFQLYSGVCNNLEGLQCFEFMPPNPTVLYHLTPGQPYFIRVFSHNLEAHDFSLCIKSFPPPPENDDCAQSTPVLPNTGPDCANVYHGTTLGATPEPGGTTPLVWYSFTATSNTHTIELLNSNLVFGNPTGLSFGIAYGTCNNFFNWNTYSSNNVALIKRLQVGETYYIAVFPDDANAAFTFDLCIKTLPLSPSNEDCTGAIELIQNASLQCDVINSGSTIGAINGGIHTCGYGDDVWYKFTATSSKYQIQASNQVLLFGYENLWIEVLQSTDCLSFTSIACKNSNEIFHLKDLIPGETYYVSVSSGLYSAFNFDLCVKAIPAPVNDLCSGAIPLIVPTNNLIFGTTYGASTSGGGVCSDAGNDVWYRFTATQSAHAIYFSSSRDFETGYNSPYSLALYGGDCNNLQALFCREDLTYSNSITTGDLIVGADYFIKIGTKENDINFSFSLYSPPAPPANDACLTANFLPVSSDENCITAVAGTTENANPTPETSSDLTNLDVKDVWYAFTTTQSNHLISIYNIFNSSYSLTAELYSGECGTMTLRGQQVCNSYGQFLQTNLTPGITYYIRIFQESNQVSDFDICVTSTTPPSNDECAGAITLTVNPDLLCTSETEINNLGATQSLPDCNGNPDNDTWFQFTATANSHYMDLSISGGTNTNMPFGVEVLEGTCGSLNTVVPCNEYLYYTGQTLQNLVPGNTYYLRLYTLPDNFKYFRICIRTLPSAPANDDCAQAEVIQTNTGSDCDISYNGTTLGATQSSVSCDGDNTHDVWYQFTATNVTHLIDVSPTAYRLGNFNDIRGLQVYEGNDCSNVTLLNCFQNTATVLATLNNLTVGGIYHIRVFTLQNSAQDFSICIRTPPNPTNTNCGSAAVITPNPNLECTNPVAATTAGLFEYYYSDCSGGTSLWHQFTASNNTYQIQLQDIIHQYGSEFISLELYSGACESLHLDYCVYGGTIIYSKDFLPGKTYYIRVVGSTFSSLKFNLCVSTIPPPDNDNCQQASSVTPNTGLICENIYTGTTRGATFGNGNTPDVWYMFTATSNSHIFELLNVHSDNENYNALFYDLFQGGDCNNLAFMTSFYWTDPAFSQALVPGETYYLRVFSNDPNTIYDFDLCIKSLAPSPANEECTGAFELTPNTGLNCDLTTAGTTEGAITRNENNCIHDNDVWYRFTATAFIHLVSIMNIAPLVGDGTLSIEVGQSTDCLNFLPLGCMSNNQPVNLDGLMPGETYYVRVASTGNTSHTYELCVQTIIPPPNDRCMNAEILSISATQECEVGVQGTTYGSGPDDFPACGNNGNDVWYSFTAIQTAHSFMLTNITDALTGASGYYGYGIEIYSGSCGNLEKQVCRIWNDGNDFFNVGELIPGTVYSIRIIAYFNDINFNICISTPPPTPVNDNCTNAFTIPVSPDESCITPISGNTANATPGFGNGVQPNDVWYAFTATEGNHILSTKNYFGTITVQVYSGACGALTLINQREVDYYGSYSPELLVTNLIPGDIYYVRVFGAYNFIYEFDLCVFGIHKPINDECAGAIPLVVDTNLICTNETVYSDYGATQSVPGCTGNPVNDTWFRFTATSSSQRVDINAYLQNFGLEILEGNCGALIPVLPCAEYYNTATVTLQHLIAGHVYYIRHYSFPNNYREITICVRSLPEPPLNDECPQAKLIMANADASCDLIYNGSTLGSTQSAVSCAGNGTHDVWYQFTATGASLLIDLHAVTFPLGNSNTPLGIEISSSSDCSVFTPIQCTENAAGNLLKLDGLNMGETYFIRIFSQNNDAHTFTLCIRTIPPYPDNVDCAHAQIITPGTNQECANPVAGNTAGLFEYYGFNCLIGTSLWYQFTAVSAFNLIQLQDIVPQYGDNFLGIELYEENCDSWWPLYCSIGAPQIQAQDLIPGNIYYIRVVGKELSGARFNLCVMTLTPPVNDDCAGAIPIPVSSVNTCENLYTGTTLGATFDPVSWNCGNFNGVWYSFVATNATHKITFNNIQPEDGSDNAIVYQLMGGDCNQLSNFGCNSPLNPVVFIDLTPGNTYYLWVGSIPGSFSTYDICISTPQPELVPYYLYVNSISCNPGSAVTIAAAFYNEGDETVQPGSTTFTLTVSGANNGIYGPFPYNWIIYPESSGTVYFYNVDLSNYGENQITVTGFSPNEVNPDNNVYSISFVGQEFTIKYLDADGDGYGNPQYGFQSCDLLQGYVANNADCDDSNPDINPDAIETCNGIDDNCNGLTDADDPDVQDTQLPEIICPENSVLQNDPGTCSAVLNYEVTVSDNCTYTLLQNSGLASGENFPVGTTLNTFTVSDPGGNLVSCSFTVEVQKTADPDLLYAYTVIGLNDVFMKTNTIHSGGIGLVNAGKKARLQLNTKVTAPNTFVKAPILELQTGSEVTNYISGQVPASLLPVFQSNSTPTSNNLVVPNNSAPISLAFASYGTVIIGTNTSAVFSGQSTVRIKELIIKAGATISFAQNTVLLVNKGIGIAANTHFNSAGTQVVQCFAAENITVEKGCDIWANMYTKKDLRLEKASAAIPTNMSGLFIATNVYAPEFIHWNWDADYCPDNPSAHPAEQTEDHSAAAAAAAGTLRIFPNPATTETEVIFDLKTDAPVTIQLLDITGHVVQSVHINGLVGSNRYRFDLGALPEGIYTVKVMALGYQGVGKLVVLRP